MNLTQTEEILNKRAEKRKQKRKEALKVLAVLLGFAAAIWLVSVIGESLGAKQPYTLTNIDALSAAAALVWILRLLETNRKKLDEIIERLDDIQSDGVPIKHR